MTAWPLVSLGQLADFFSGGTPDTKVPEYYSGTTPWISSADISEDGTVYAHRFITEEAIKSSTTRICSPGSLFLVTRVGVGKACIINHPTAFSQDIVWIRSDNEIVDNGYLLHFLRNPGKARLHQLARGATIQGVTLRDVKELRVPLPPLDEQRRITGILDNVQDLRNKTNRHVSLAARLANLTPEASDPIGVSLSRYVSSVSSGKNVAEADSNTSGARVLKVSAVTSRYFRAEESKLLPDSYLPPKEHRVEIGDLIVSRANTQELIGAAALVQEEVDKTYLPDKLWRLNLKDNVDQHFLWCLLGNRAIRSRISQRASGSSGSMKNISQKNFLSLPVPNFSATEQAEIGARVRASLQYTELLEVKVKKLDELYNSLATRAFAGEL